MFPFCFANQTSSRSLRLTHQSPGWPGKPPCRYLEFLRDHKLEFFNLKFIIFLTQNICLRVPTSPGRPCFKLFAPLYAIQMTHLAVLITISWSNSLLGQLAINFVQCICCRNPCTSQQQFTSSLLCQLVFRNGCFSVCIRCTRCINCIKCTNYISEFVHLTLGCMICIEFCEFCRYINCMKMLQIYNVCISTLDFQICLHLSLWIQV